MLTRRYGDFDAAEDATQEALLAAAEHWPVTGVPESPVGWLVRTASRRLVDLHRSEQSRRRREVLVAGEVLPGEVVDADDTLVLLFLCCHESLSPSSAIALTLRAVGGLTTAEVARAFLVPEATMAQRISRGKQRIRAAGARFQLPAPDERQRSIELVLRVLYLIYNEGYASTGDRLQRADLADEAIRLARLLHGLLPDDAEASGLLALMLLLDARRPARVDGQGRPVPLPQQDRTTWDRSRIAEGTALLEQALAHGRVGEYQLQAAITAAHDRAGSAPDTDWAQILALYGLLERVTDSPVVTLNRAVALAMVEGPDAGLALVETVRPLLEQRGGTHRLYAVRAHLLELAGRTDAAREDYLTAASRTTSLPERHHLTEQAARLGIPAAQATAERR